MAVRVVNASRSMTWEEVQTHVPAIKAHFEKLAARFPADLTVQALLGHILEGRRDLWLILDGDTVLASCCTSLEAIDATGARVLRLVDLAGENITAWAGPLLEAMEAYGDENQVDFLAVEGRHAWRKIIEPMGFKHHSSLWRRPSKGREGQAGSDAVPVLHQDTPDALHSAS